MRVLSKWGALLFSTALCVMSSNVPMAQAATAATAQTLSVAVSRANYGIDVFSYDSQLNAPSTIPGLTQLGMGMQQFPNANEWSWVSNSFRQGGQAPVSLNDWGNILQATHNQGLFIFNYDENPQFTGGGTPANATQLTQYIVAHHLPITSIVIGSEEYGSWDHYANLNPSFSSQYYAQQSALIAQAIHAVDPAMKVGVSFSLGNSPQSLRWDQTVLRATGPYINFVSIHDYPNSGPLSNGALLASLPNEVRSAMHCVQSEINANVAPTYASHIQTWVTEFNPYGQPGAQSIQPVYGAAMVESAMLWRAFGASKLFIWSYDGQAHTATSAWPVATNAKAPYGLFALAGDGQSPELPMNTLYPSGQALSQYMQAIGSGGRLSVWVTPQTVIGQVQSGQQSRVFAINTSSLSQNLPLQNSTVRLSPASMKIIASPAPVNSQALTPPVTDGPLDASSNTHYQSAIPNVSNVLTGYPGEPVTVSGSEFGSPGPHSHVIVSQNGVNYGGPGDAYTVTIQKWTPNQISFIVPNGQSGPSLSPGSAAVEIETTSRLISSQVPITITPVPVLPSHIETTNSIYPGSTITITGTGFGSAMGAGYILLSQNGIQYGAPQDAYKVTVLSWSNTSITLQIPNGASGPALIAGSATVQVTTNAGLHTQPLSLIIGLAPQLPAALASTSTVQPGQWVTITGSGFGSTQGQGFIKITQGSVNYGAPGDWYHVAIAHWSNTSVTFLAPIGGRLVNGNYEASLSTGPATVSVVANNGLASAPLTMTVR